MKRILGTCALGALLAGPASASLYNETFEVDPTANWTVNAGPSDSAANFFFDYSSVGIPAAPGGAGTRGMKLQANLTNGIFGGFSVSPTGFDAGAGDYKLSFDWWSNFNGPFPGGGSGSTNLSTFGIGTDGTTTQWPGGVQNSVWFAATGDGGSASDWRAYSSAAGTSYADGSPVYAFSGSGSRNSSNPFFAANGFGSNSAPAAQLGLFPGQTGTTAPGSAGMEWHQVEIEKAGNSITWTVNGVLLATVDATTVTLAGGNIHFGHSDINATSSTDALDADLLFTLIDNVVVTPEPTSLVLLALGSVAAFRRR